MCSQQTRCFLSALSGVYAWDWWLSFFAFKVRDNTKTSLNYNLLMYRVKSIMSVLYLLRPIYTIRLSYTIVILLYGNTLSSGDSNQPPQCQTLKCDNWFYCKWRDQLKIAKLKVKWLCNAIGYEKTVMTYDVHRLKIISTKTKSFVISSYRRKRSHMETRNSI